MQQTNVLDFILTQLASVLAFLKNRIQGPTDQNAPDLPKVLRKTTAKNLARTLKQDTQKLLKSRAL